MCDNFYISRYINHMDIKVTGNRKLEGRITPSGNKNAVLPMLCATLLTDEPITLTNVPNLTDVAKILDVYSRLNVNAEFNQHQKVLRIQNDTVNLDQFNGSLPLGMRASILLLAPMLARFGELDLDFNIGGCTLGIRDVDPHIYMLEELGAEVHRESSRLTLRLPKGRFQGANLWPDYASVTGTENAIMAAVLAEGTTVIYNAASEPHVQNLCEMLVSMGAKIDGIGSNRLIIEGVEKLHGCETRVIADHHEITTFLALGAMTGGRVEVEDALPEHFPLINNAFAKLGVEIKYDGNIAYVEENQSFEPTKAFTETFINRIEAAPWPYFPADLLPLMISLSLKTKGITRFWNKIYEGGLFWTAELVKTGAKLELSDPHRLMVIGPTKLTGAKLDCPPIIRATVALIMAAMAADGESILLNIDTVYRAHPNFVENLRLLGAEIQEIGS